MCCSKNWRFGVNELAGIIYGCRNLSPRLQRGSAWLSRVQPRSPSHNDAVQKEKLSWSSAASIVHALQLGGSFIRVDLNCMHLFLGCVRVCTSPFSAVSQLRSETKQKNRYFFLKAFHARCVSSFLSLT